MRRKLPDTFQGECKLSGAERPRAPLLDVRLGLECITPVIGGGVRAREPDTIDIVRVPGIRGQLRFWWRALSSERDADALFEEEVRIWGGVRDAGKGAVASRVRVSVDAIDDPGPFPAGTHEQRRGRAQDDDRSRDGRDTRGGEAHPKLSPIPTWNTKMAGLAYAAFPLQRSKEDLQSAQRDGSLHTWPIRTGLRFTLRLALGDAPAGTTTESIDEQDRERILWTVWAWVHFGGIGGRTTRGFGALAPMKVEGLRSTETEWEARFRRPAADGAAAWLRAQWSTALLGRAVRERGELRGWTHFGSARLAIGGVTSTNVGPRSAHAMVLDGLRVFRQGVGVGRMPSQRGKPVGESYWPEAHMLRVQAENQGHQAAWAHGPPDGARRCVSPNPTPGMRPWIPARAAFGLPIQMHFMDREDKPAEGTIELGRPGGRWMSPLRLRPIACANGQQVPVALLFAARPWPAPDSDESGRGLLITVRRHGKAEAVYLADGAAQPSPRGSLRAEGWMQPGDVDAAGAFFDWLVNRESMVSV